jgi:hypothetical protein
MTTPDNGHSKSCVNDLNAFNLNFNGAEQVTDRKLSRRISSNSKIIGPVSVESLEQQIEWFFSNKCES